MSSFELVNHQLKHMFGGIEAQRNTSLQYLQTSQKKIAKSMQKAQVNHMKIYQAVNTIKTSLMELSENYLALSKENKHSGGLISKLSSQINSFLQEVSEQSLSLSKKMESKVETYVPNLKKIKQKYTQCAQNLQHYRKKVGLLQKNVEKQSLANIKQDQHERFQRNKQKLRNAEKQYDQILIKTTRRFIQFNSEGMRDVFNDLAAIFTTIGGNMMRFTSSLSKHLCDSFSANEILLSKQLKVRRGSDKAESIDQLAKGKKDATGEWLKIQTSENKKALFQHLIQDKQISNYLKKIVDKQAVKAQSEKIHEVFKIKKQQQKENSTFTQFKNHYNNFELKHHQHHLLQKLKQQDPIEACQDLLEIDDPTEISQAISQDQISKYQIQCSNESSPQIFDKNAKDQQRIKANLQKFNQLYKSNKQKSSSNLGKIFDKAISPNSKAIQSYKNKNNYVTQKTVLKSPDQFFNLNYLDQKKEEKSKNPQQQLQNMHQHAFDFNLLGVENKPHLTKQNSTPKSSIFVNFAHTNNTLSFDNFEIFVKEQKGKDEKGLSDTPNSKERKKAGNTVNLLNL